MAELSADKVKDDRKITKTGEIFKSKGKLWGSIPIRV